MITILSKPPALILAKQPVSFQVKSNLTTAPSRIVGSVYTIGSDSVQPDANKCASFEFSDYLRGVITERYKTDDVPGIYASLAREITFIFLELVGSPPVPRPEIESDPFYLLDGYVPKSRRKSLYSNYSNVLDYLISSKSFLSWWPAEEAKKVLPDQKEFLNFIQVFSPDPVTLSLRSILYFTDGSSVSYTIPGTVPDVNFMNVVYFPAGYKQTGLEAYMKSNFPSKTLKVYSLAVMSGASKVSADQYYMPDNSYYENLRILYIRNAFGMLEIFHCTGQASQVNSFSIETVRTDGRILPEKVSWKCNKAEVVKADTGFLTPAQMQWLSDMDFMEAYELIGTTLHPIVFHDLDLSVVHDGVYQYSAILEYEYSATETTEQA